MSSKLTALTTNPTPAITDLLYTVPAAGGAQYKTAISAYSFVVGPTSAVSDEIAVFSGTTGKIVKQADGPITITAGGSNQDITITPSGTGETHTAKRVSIGEASDPAYWLYIRGTSDTTKTRAFNIEFNPTLSASTSTAFRGEAISMTINTAGFNATGVIRGANYAVASNGVGGTLSQLVGFHGAVTQNGSTVITVAKGASSNLGIAGTTNILTGYNFYGDATTSGGGGLIPTYYGAYIENPGTGFGATLAAAFSAPWASASNRYGLYFPGTVQHSLGGVVTVAAATATPAAGSTSARLLFGTTAGFGIYYGSGAPTVSAAQGSLYLRSDGTSVTRAYINTDGSTTWTALVSVA